MNAELAEGGALEFAVGRVILDPLRVAAELVALVQHRRMAVGQPRAFVEMAAGHGAEPVEMRLDVAERRVRQMQAQQIGQRRIGPVKIHAGGVGREQSRRIGNGGPAIVLEWLHIWPLSFPPILDVIDHYRYRTPKRGQQA